ncbi:MAG: glycoside hydrolase family 3 protein [Chloroflexi bacterium AL-W]|nr:glycoside hydrolase family 3 protein [Chloroflexi bacterium AL-N1]NOK65292.1 glycoside hydrolase family 3 protein [Chloroflexi bacterium AL-N10]NOK72443.1 glycoside hydrolase family 3 protein [Chloroflexi bacterium AL-N5]NOK79471.1 glycoside hydrolase family 3 protein [Chloroflexi bacterium AL-W]NOK87387.1 glycoside hydrolase family 3 protein [Chloroflexi bacterium AL-N15]
MQLSLEQSVGQKLMASFIGTEPPQGFLARCQRQSIGGVTLFRALNTTSPAQVRQLTATLQQAMADADQPPLLIAVDQEGGQLMAIDGGTTLFPGNMAIGATNSVDLAHRTGYALGRELASMGVNVNYAPICDVNSNPLNPAIGTRSFGEDTVQVMRLSAAMILGMQSAGIAATAKHFPGHGDTANDTHYGIAIVQHDEAHIRQVELPPFAAAIEAGVQLMMTAHVAFPAFEDGHILPATLSPNLLRGLLREELGFQGVIISDALEMAAIMQGSGLVIDGLSAAAASVDLLLLNAEEATQQILYDGLLQATQRRLLTPSEISASAQRILALKDWLANMPQPALDVIGSSEHRTLARETAERSITLVRDDANLLPLRAGPDTRLAVVVPRPTDLTLADTSSYVDCSLAEHLRDYHPIVDEFVVASNPAEDDLADVLQSLAGYDMIIIGTINATVQSGQATLVKRLLAGSIPTIVVALRMPYDLMVFPDAPTYVCTYSILPPSLKALAAVLYGQIPFQGRLPVSIPELYPVGHGDTVQLV